MAGREINGKMHDLATDPDLFDTLKRKISDISTIFFLSKEIYYTLSMIVALFNS